MAAHMSAKHTTTTALQGQSTQTVVQWTARRLGQGNDRQRALIPANVPALIRGLKEQDPFARQVLQAEDEMPTVKRGKRSATAQPSLSPSDKALVPDGSCVLFLPSCQECRQMDNGRTWDPASIAKSYHAHHRNSRHRCMWGRAKVCLATVGKMTEAEIADHLEEHVREMEGQIVDPAWAQALERAQAKQPRKF
ncbi:unnamed protein product [Parajaminaea phylloscopi]